MRPIVILILVIIAVAMVRMLLGDVIKAVSKSMASTPEEQNSGPKSSDSTPGRLVKDPETGSYIDERTAVRAEIKGKAYFFESTTSRDAFIRRNRA